MREFESNPERFAGLSPHELQLNLRQLCDQLPLPSDGMPEPYNPEFPPYWDLFEDHLQGRLSVSEFKSEVERQSGKPFEEISESFEFRHKRMESDHLKALQANLTNLLTHAQVTTMFKLRILSKLDIIYLDGVENSVEADEKLYGVLDIAIPESSGIFDKNRGIEIEHRSLKNAIEQHDHSIALRKKRCEKRGMVWKPDEHDAGQEVMLRRWQKEFQKYYNQELL